MQITRPDVLILSRNFRKRRRSAE